MVDMNCGSQFENKHFIREAVFNVNNCISRIGFFFTFWCKQCSKNTLRDENAKFKNNSSCRVVRISGVLLYTRNKEL